MRVELRKRVIDDTHFFYDVILIPEPQESLLLDHAFGNTVGEDGMIAQLEGHVKLSDGFGQHYIQLRRKDEIHTS